MPLSTWPSTRLPILAELYVNGAWADISNKVRLDREVTIVRGRANEQGRPAPATCNFTLNNRDGLFSNRNPNSTYYGKLTRNTPFRVSVTEDRSFAIITDTSAARVYTVDKAVLDLVGDLDIRCEFEPDNYTGNGNGMILCAKYRRSTPNRSWVVYLTALNYLVFTWTTDGSTINTATSTVPLSTQYGPQAIKVTIDVDNGAAGRTITFYTGDTINGTYNTLGAAVVQAGVTSIFGGAADIELGRIDDGAKTGITGVSGYTGRFYGFQLRNGIAGTVVATADIASQTRGTVSWSDGLATPNTWLVASPAELTPDDRRFTGEISALPVAWDTSGKDVWCDVQAADVTRRLTQGNAPLRSAMRTFFASMTSVGYWPGEDATSATRIASVTPGVASGVTTGATFTTPSDLPASAGAFIITDATFRANFSAKGSGTGSACFNFAWKFAIAPASLTTLVDIFVAEGTAGRVNISVGPATFDMAIYASDGTLITSNSTGIPATTPSTSWILMRIQFQQVGGNVQADIGWYKPGENVLWGAAALNFAGTSGRFSGGQFKATTQNLNTQICHVFIGQFFLDNTTTAYTTAASAFVGETTTSRFTRVCTQNNILNTVIGSTSFSEAMGVQPIASIMDVLYECLDLESGQLYADRNSLGLVFRTRRSMINQDGPIINYTNDELSGQLLPVDDDQFLRNYVTASKPTGSSATAEVTTGPNSTQAPPNGVNRYEVPVSRNPYLDSRLDALAAWEAFLGTWDEARYPLVQVNLERQNYTTSAANIRKGHILSHLDMGDMFVIQGLPAWLPPDNAYLLVQGMTEVLRNRGWEFRFNTSPYGPFNANDTSQLVLSRYRAGTANSTLAATMTTTSLSVTVTVPGVLWGTTALKPGNFPLNIVVAGEVMTVSGIVGTASPQTFTISARSVNTVVKTHAIGESVQVQYPFTGAL